MKRLISIAVSLAILSIVWAMLDRGAIWAALKQTDPGLLALSLLWLVGLVGISALRLIALARVTDFFLPPRRALEATFVANTLNMVLPGKLGDLLKAASMADAGAGELPAALSLGAWEKLMDLVMLFVVAALASGFLGGAPVLTAFLALAGGAGLAVALVPGVIAFIAARMGARGVKFAEAWGAMLGRLRARPGGLATVVGMTALLWAGHLVQIAMMMTALGVTGDAGFWGQVLAMIPIAIVAGLVPLTFAGVGTRDAAIVTLFGGMIGGETAAALGVLFWLRYLVPGLFGLPLVPRYTGQIRAHLRARRAGQG
ncbi:lysylphosphatidylglycerol synthase transmembrane domain-containing protein [Aliiruegeria sabulilitoris]|uniref:lysylphosphatidylglycerol synthase transmembrane domain-containing protein n=1 Tax=Aliiruegeria sabulilitoris TaxID=1510458 RepID=UPI00082EB65A|nr:lysylphosphatidylglycerol synthase transmembrane domain-containing protein [Aliiruegeria sabulilitoris]NDR56041.1 flippase-like domain-containing protein [Pseudoruegeria sp. M32A2M]